MIATVNTANTGTATGMTGTGSAMTAGAMRGTDTVSAMFATARPEIVIPRAEEVLRAALEGRTTKNLRGVRDAKRSVGGSVGAAPLVVVMSSVVMGVAPRGTKKEEIVGVVESIVMV